MSIADQVEKNNEEYESLFQEFMSIVTQEHFPTQEELERLLEIVDRRAELNKELTDMVDKFM